MHKLTGKQCRQARGLLKWNVYDLSSHVSGINAKRIESYERGMVHIAEWENDEMVTAFRKAGIQFNDELDVTLKEKAKSGGAVLGGSGEGAHIALNADQSILADSTAVNTSLLNEGTEDSETEKSARTAKN